MDSLVVGFSLDDRKELVWKLHGDLVHGECHLVNVKGYGFGSLGISLVTSNDSRLK